MSVLSKTTILKLCESVKLIDPHKEVNAFGSSYDLEVGNEYYLCCEDKIDIKPLKEGEKFSIPSYKVCFVISEEKVNIPTNIAATVSLKSEFVQKGLVLSSQPPIDGGYQGKVYALLHNLTNRNIQLQRGVPFLSVVFYKLDKGGPPYRGEYQGMTSLSQLKYLEPFESALKELEEDTKRARDRWENALPRILQAITIAVGVLAVLLTILTVSGLINVWKTPSTPTSTPTSVPTTTPASDSIPPPTQVPTP